MLERQVYERQKADQRAKEADQRAKKAEFMQKFLYIIVLLLSVRSIWMFQAEQGFESIQ